MPPLAGSWPYSGSPGPAEPPLSSLYAGAVDMGRGGGWEKASPERRPRGRSPAEAQEPGVGPRRDPRRKPSSAKLQTATVEAALGFIPLRRAWRFLKAPAAADLRACRLGAGGEGLQCLPRPNLAEIPPAPRLVPAL